MKKILCRSNSGDGLFPVLWVLLIACFSLGADFLSVYPTNVYKGLDVPLFKEITSPVPASQNEQDLTLQSQPVQKNHMRDIVNNKWRAYMAIARST
jgi:hypothetical protein